MYPTTQRPQAACLAPRRPGDNSQVGNVGCGDVFGSNNPDGQLDIGYWIPAISNNDSDAMSQINGPDIQRASWCSCPKLLVVCRLPPKLTLVLQNASMVAACCAYCLFTNTRHTVDRATLPCYETYSKSQIGSLVHVHSSIVLLSLAGGASI